jgi:hypothetical protein
LRHFDKLGHLISNPVADDDSDNESLCAPAVDNDAIGTQRAAEQEEASSNGDDSDPESDNEENPDDIESPDKRHAERRLFYNDENKKLVSTKKKFVV